MQMIDTGTSAQDHIGALYQVYNASTGSRAIKINPSTLCTGQGIEFAAN